ncbi:unnamed protein product [Ostreobium quekettii]|uniref:Ubiquitin-like 1-activating enzyme E1A n=1 Tax=Ostreobium quekettii TaxID=121088 RepID=A0A8S1IZW2_9CHLO|nr:unnamed protein product [Ostreobium quekettii]|eukprot:evm.model.scf_121.9 EVM.evm.TU.scf_121.9   scf_121:84823-88538(-)
MAKLSEAEAAVYDRQIRVWGVEVQKRLQASKVLLIGCSGLAAEVAKNIVLAGVGSLSLMDDTPCSSGALGNFLIPANVDGSMSVASASVVTLQEMNPLVNVRACPGLGWSSELAEGFREYDVIVQSGGNLAERQQLDEWCSENGIKFFTASVHGTVGYLFANLQSHTFTLKEDKGKEASDMCVERTKTYPRLSAALCVPQKNLPNKTHCLYFILQVCAEFQRRLSRPPAAADIEDVKSLARRMAADGGLSERLYSERLLSLFVEGAGELAAVCAIVGGILGNEIVKVVSGRGEPLRNFFFFSLHDGRGVAQEIGCA